MTVGALSTTLEEMINDVRHLVIQETPSADLVAVRKGAHVVAGIGERLLGRAPELPEHDGVTHVLWPASTDGDSVLLLGHQDTVWPRGTLERLPFDVNDEILRGPGTFDMKVGVVQILHAAHALERELQTGVTILITGDEELGSRSSRTLIERWARASSAVLVAEGSADGGALKIARKGASVMRLEVKGIAAHAGLEPWRGSNATVELAGHVADIVALADDALATTVTPTVISGGSTANTVPDRASLDVDVRAWDSEEQRRIESALRSLLPHLPGTRLSVSAEHSPPLEEAMSSALFVLASQVADELGIALPPGARVGGASDANFAAGAGTPTLDGFGAVGGGAHAEDEHVFVSHIVPRTAFLAEMLTRLLTRGIRPRSDER